MKIDIITNDGSPLSVTEKSIFGEDGRAGVGGSELFMLTLCRAWHEAGYDVTLYNNPDTPNGSVFKQKNIDEFVPEEDRDIVIIWRSPNDRLTPETKGLKVWTSCDQYTVGNFKQFATKVDKIVVISPFHAQHFRNQYGIHNTIVIDIPIRVWEYENKNVEKVPYKCLFNHVPGRGINELRDAWALIVRDFPEATLVVTGDETLWSNEAWMKQNVSQRLSRFRMSYARIPNVSILGAVNRAELIQHQLEAEIELYPCVYDELFDISTAENQVAGCYPITSGTGAVSTTNMGTVIPGSPHSPQWVDEFVETTLGFLRDRERLQREAKALQEKAKERFSLEKVLEIWDKEVFNEGN